jgi:hypothetical protein
LLCKTQRRDVSLLHHLTLIELLPEEFPGSMAEANFSHYQLRYAHGSSLSAVESGGDSRREGRVCSSS